MFYREGVDHPDPGHSMHVPVVGQHPSKVMSLFPQPPHPRYQCWRGVSLGCRKVLKIHLCLNIEVGGAGGRPPSRKRDITFEGGGSTSYRNFWPDFGASGAQRIVYRIWPTPLADSQFMASLSSFPDLGSVPAPAPHIPHADTQFLGSPHGYHDCTVPEQHQH